MDKQSTLLLTQGSLSCEGITDSSPSGLRGKPCPQLMPALLFDCLFVCWFVFGKCKQLGRILGNKVEDMRNLSHQEPENSSGHTANPNGLSSGEQEKGLDFNQILASNRILLRPKSDAQQLCQKAWHSLNAWPAWDGVSFPVAGSQEQPSHSVWHLLSRRWWRLGVCYLVLFVAFNAYLFIWIYLNGKA